MVLLQDASCSLPAYIGGFQTRTFRLAAKDPRVTHNPADFTRGNKRVCVIHIYVILATFHVNHFKKHMGCKKGTTNGSICPSAGLFP